MDDEERDWRIYLAYTAGRKTQLAISREFNIGQQRVSQIIASVRASLPVDTVEEMREKSLRLYDELIRKALEIVDLTPAPVFVGKDGAIAYDEDGSVVRDYSGRLNAMQVAAKMDAELRKLHGLDAATKVEQSGSVRFEIVGVDTEDLS
jgi:hypothetical protein